MLGFLAVFRHGYREWGYPGIYIVALASALHFSWAVLLCFNSSALEAIPLTILYAFLGSRWLVVSLLFLVSILAGIFLNIRNVYQYRVLSILLIPQQVVLLFSAGAGVWASITEFIGLQSSLPEGFSIPSAIWAHTLAAELPVVMLAILYVAALVEIQKPPVHNLYWAAAMKFLKGQQGAKGEQGAQGEKGDKGDKGDNASPV